MRSNKKPTLPRSITMSERLSRLLEVFHGDDHVLVFINADPDSISSALALKRLLWRHVSSVTITCNNQVTRPDNLAMLNLLKVPLIHYHNINPEKFSRKTMVDSQPLHLEYASKIKFDLIIDHHPETKFDARVADIRPDYGATATIMVEYLRAAKIKPNRSLSTALFYGIKTDTQNFVRQGQLEDMRAFRYLFPQVNMNLINKIENSGMSKAGLKDFNKALGLVKTRRERAWVYMGKVDTPDILVQLADFFMRVHDINQSFTAGIFKDNLIIICRTVGFRKDAGKLVLKAFGHLGHAGGHKAMARAEIPLSNIDDKLLEKDGALEKFLLKQLN